MWGRDPSDAESGRIVRDAFRRKLRADAAKIRP